MSASDEKPAYVITLIHGTFAPNAAWTQPGSDLRKFLERRLGGPGRVQFEVFNWHGFLGTRFNNAHKYRRQGSQRLREHLAEVCKPFEGPKRFLIAHSHGGNVALHALAGSDLMDEIAGVVCLATPFLTARERDLGRQPLKQLAGPVLVLSGLAYWTLDEVLPVSWPHAGRIAIMVFVLLALLGALAVLGPKWWRFAKQLGSELATPRFDQDKLLIIRSPGDEASGALVLFQLISQISVMLYLKGWGLYGRFESAAKGLKGRWLKMLAVAAGALVPLAGAVLLAASLPWDRGYTSWVQVAAIVLALASFLAAIGALSVALGCAGLVTVFLRTAIGAVVWPVIALLSILLLLPFGVAVAMANILLDVTAETIPTGRWVVYLIKPPTSKELGRETPPLTHSVYENRRVLACVSCWIKNRSRAVGGPDEPEGMPRAPE
jgi:hypothetical protein